MQIGKYKVRIVESGNFGLDGGAMFGVVPKNLWERAYQVPDDKNRITLSTRLLYIEGEGKKILVDTGNGTKLDEKSQNIYGINPEDRGAADRLLSLGINRDEITDVILTHLHFDHVGGATEYNSKGEAEPVFKNAKYHVQKSQLEWARNPTMKDRASFMPENYEPLSVNGMLNVVDGDGELFTDIFVQPVDGHTRGMQMITIKSDTDSLLYPADLSPTSAHLKIPYVMGYDNEPLQTIKEKQNFIVPAAEERQIIVFEHDAFTPYGRLNMSEKGPIVTEDSSLSFE